MFVVRWKVKRRKIILLGIKRLKIEDFMAELGRKCEL